MPMTCDVHSHDVNSCMTASQPALPDPDASFGTASSLLLPFSSEVSNTGSLSTLLPSSPVTSGNSFPSQCTTDFTGQYCSVIFLGGFFSEKLPLSMNCTLWENYRWCGGTGLIHNRCENHGWLSNTGVGSVKYCRYCWTDDSLAFSLSAWHATVRHCIYKVNIRLFIRIFCCVICCFAAIAMCYSRCTRWWCCHGLGM